MEKHVRVTKDSIQIPEGMSGAALRNFLKKNKGALQRKRGLLADAYDSVAVPVNKEEEPTGGEQLQYDYRVGDVVEWRKGAQAIVVATSSFVDKRGKIKHMPYVEMLQPHNGQYRIIPSGWPALQQNEVQEKYVKKPYSQTEENMKKARVTKAYRQALKDGGVTVTADWRLFEMISGYIVSLAGYEKVVPKAKLRETMQSFKAPDASKLIGVWKDSETGLYHVDVSVHVEDLREAIFIGKKNKQKAIWDIFENKEIRLIPSNQK